MSSGEEAEQTEGIGIRAVFLLFVCPFSFFLCLFILRFPGILRVGLSSRFAVCRRWLWVEGSIHTVGLEDAQDLVAGHNADLGNAVRVSQDDTDLGRGGALLGQLADLLDDLVGRGLEPRGNGAGVGNGGGRNALSVAVKTTHIFWWRGMCGDGW